MDIRFLVVGAPFLVGFLYALFWLKRWGAFNSDFGAQSKKNEGKEYNFILENIFLTKY